MSNPYITFYYPFELITKIRFSNNSFEFKLNHYKIYVAEELRVRLARRETGLSPPVKYFTDSSKAVLLLWIFYVFVLSRDCYVFVHVCFICALWSPAGKGLTSWLSFVVSNCEFVTFPLVSWVRCGT